jgi:N-acetylmuramoyl-L-alanine amidase
VRDLQRRLAAAGFLAPGAAEDSTFCARTHSAVIAFQDAFGLSATGVVDDVMWSTLIEASWSIGDRILYERTPNLRGDDVAELQSVLNRLGFDCGRVDGVFGPLTHSALIDFQRNMGLNANGIAAPDVVAMLLRVSSQSGDGPGVALVREREELTDSTSPLTARVVLGGFDGVTDVLRATQHRAHDAFPFSTTVESDALTQARAANEYGADVYVGFESNETDDCVIYFYEVPTFHSVGGKALADRIAATMRDRVPELTVRTQGMRHPVLRETRMPAVLCSLGPQRIVRLKVTGVANAMVSSLRDWLAAPLEG